MLPSCEPVIAQRQADPRASSKAFWAMVAAAAAAAGVPSLGPLAVEAAVLCTLHGIPGQEDLQLQAGHDGDGGGGDGHGRSGMARARGPLVWTWRAPYALLGSKGEPGGSGCLKQDSKRAHMRHISKAH